MEKILGKTFLKKKPLKNFKGGAKKKKFRYTKRAAPPPPN